MSQEFIAIASVIVTGAGVIVIWLNGTRADRVEKKKRKRLQKFYREWDK